jgi:hypothetical protein
MSGEETTQQPVVEGAAADRVLAVFGDAEPRTTQEVAIAVDAPVPAVEGTLDELADGETLSKKRIEVDGTAATIWYRPLVEAEDEQRLEDAIADLAVPGTSEMMRSWRRDAVRAAAEYVHEHGRVSGGELREEVFPSHSAAYDDPDVWWEMVADRLPSLPGVEHARGDEYHWVG